MCHVILLCTSLVVIQHTLYNLHLPLVRTTLQPTQQAEDAERAQPPFPVTCRAIVAAVIDVGVEDEDRRRTYKADAEECLKRGSAETARAIYAHALQLFPGKKGLWRCVVGL